MKNIHGRKMINFSVKRQLQFRLLCKVLGIVFVGVGIMAVIFYFYSNREINDSYRQFHVNAKNFLDYLWPAVISSLLLSTVAAIGITLFLPQRIAGPLYRIEKDLNDVVSRGDLTHRIELRKGDEVTDLAEAVNMTVDSLREKIERINEPAVKLNAKIIELQGQTDHDIQRLAKETHEALKEFKLK
jgi:methyl-accepting chemotaxis protein